MKCTCVERGQTDTVFYYIEPVRMIGCVVGVFCAPRDCKSLVQTPGIIEMSNLMNIVKKIWTLDYG